EAASAIHHAAHPKTGVEKHASEEVALVSHVYHRSAATRSEQRNKEEKRRGFPHCNPPARNESGERYRKSGARQFQYWPDYAPSFTRLSTVYSGPCGRNSLLITSTSRTSMVPPRQPVCLARAAANRSSGRSLLPRPSVMCGAYFRS